MGKVSSVYSMCGMCAVRCPIRVEVEDGVVRWIEGNPHEPGLRGSICAKGSAGVAFEYDSERPQYPMIRDGERGSGTWKKATWDEALDYIAEKLKDVIKKYGSKAIALSDRSGPFTDLTTSFLKALGSPNYFNHDDTCAKNVDMACRSLFGFKGRGDFSYDFTNTKHIILYARNVFESLQVKEVNNILDALDKGAKLTYMDCRATVTASKADRFFMIRPGTTYAINLALINVILKERLYDIDFVNRMTTGLTELESFVAPYTPEWAEKESGIPAQEIINLARDVSNDKPKVIFHPGWMLSRHTNSFYDSRAIYILNVLMGNIETKGGLIVAKGPADAGRKPLNSLGAKIPDVKDKIVDAEMKDKPFGTGHVVNLYKAIKTGEPYSIKAYFAYRYDPIASLPDPEAQKKVLNNLDLLVSIDVNYSQTGWYSDVILPESTYLERSNIIGTVKGSKPSFVMRRQAIAPRFDSKPAWEIFTLIAEKMGASQYFPYKSIEDIWNYQLEGTGVKIEDFNARGSVSLAKDPILKDRNELKFKTPSGKIEFVSQELIKSGFESFKQYEAPLKPEKGKFRLIFGRSAVHTHAQSQNNIYLNEIMPENVLWINEKEAKDLGINDGDIVEVSSDGFSGTIKAKVTPYIHPEAVFMVHGFGNEIPLKTRSYKKGLSDNKFQIGLLEKTDPVGGGVAFNECFVSIKKG
ncbi:molybdopterin-containing oxidoreductase family protein [Thermodesulfovibrio thiophilus]|uniref:molybdopterin-containing oxidoreductase family protein n=1 Tax=Thermodesulfovibrio thiophilus TaxID=340095 RepID=UPI0017CBFF1C|nr:molybdopterin-dependent oxidoreductase [Thermodesulfovibrio thiophilus]HHW21140.1 molybdopterin-dependent oxidoreductase [Thermodesulfovibrio thiophilus]